MYFMQTLPLPHYWPFFLAQFQFMQLHPDYLKLTLLSLQLVKVFFFTSPLAVCKVFVGTLLYLLHLTSVITETISGPHINSTDYQD